MAKTLARTFYASDADHDGAWGTDVRALIAATPGSLANSQNNHGTTATTNTITYDPYTISTATGDRGSNFGWAINAVDTSTEGMGSALNARRIIPAGDWTFGATVNIPAGGAVTGTLTVFLTFKVYRVSAAGARTFLFSSQSGNGASNALAAANNVRLTSTKTAQPVYILEPGETLHLAIDSTCTQVAGALGATVQGSIVMQQSSTVAPQVVVPAPGVRTMYQEELDAAAEGAGLRITEVEKSHVAAADGVASFTRVFDAFRVYDAVGEGLASLRPKTLKIFQPVQAMARAIDGMTLVYKKALLIRVVGTAQKEYLVVKKFTARKAVGVSVLVRRWDIFRPFLVEAVGVGDDIQRVVIFVRNFLGKAVPRIRPRISLPWDDLPDAAGGGTTVIRKIIQIFDD